MSWTIRIVAAAGILSLVGCASALPHPSRRPFEATPLSASRPPQLSTQRPEELLPARVEPPGAYTATIIKKRVQIIVERTNESYIPTATMIGETALLMWHGGLSKELKLARRARDQRPRGQLRDRLRDQCSAHGPLG